MLFLLIDFFVNIFLVLTFTEELYLFFGSIHAGEYQDCEYGHLNACDVVIGSDSDSYCRKYPNTCGGSDADDDTITREDNTASEETDACNYLADNPKVQSFLMV